ncbi:MAG: cytochrome c-type biogenesis protein CcmH [Anaerolineae bacterium]
MKKHHWLLLVGLTVLAILLMWLLMIVTASPSIAPTKPSSQNLDDATMQVARELYCPVCPNTPLDVCDTQACQQWRALIHDKLAAGETAEQIQQYFVSQYGQRVLGAPRPEGFNLGVYLAPIVAVVAGALILLVAARRWQRQRAAAAAPAGPAEATGEYRERIERELKESE